MVNAQSDHGILNNLEKKETIEHTKKPEKTEAKEAKEITPATSPEVKGKSATIVIDPGHQETGNQEQEPIGPGATETKPKVADGTSGVATDKPEYELTLEASVLLKEVLEEKGFDVILTRSSNQVDMSNSERSKIANDENADLFLRIHADGAENSEVSGFSVLTPGEENQYTDNIYDDSLLASEKIIAHVGENIDLYQNGLLFRNDLSGFNWSEVPVVLVELGFMTNPEEDKKLSDEAYLIKLTNWIADGVEEYIEEKE